MKTLTMRSLLLMLATVFTFGYTRAAEPVRLAGKAPRTALERNLFRALDRHVIYPVADTKGELHGEVTVSFVVDRDGRLEVLECNSTNERLRSYVLERLARIDVGDNPEGIWKTSHIRFVFKPEKNG